MDSSRRPVLTGSLGGVRRVLVLAAVLLGVACTQQASAQAAQYVTGVSGVSVPTTSVDSSVGPQGYGGGAGMSCSSGSCVAVGYSQDTSGNDRPLSVAITDGTPGTAANISLPGDADLSYASTFNDVSCWAAGSCLAVGLYNDAAGYARAITSTIVNGQAGAASGITLPGNANASAGSSLFALSCWAAGSCVAVGQYHTSVPNYQSMVVPIAGGTAATGVAVTLPGNAIQTVDQTATLNDVDCWSAGSCVAVGTYYGTGVNQEPMVVPITNGVPGTAVEPSLPTVASGGVGNVNLQAVSCSAGGLCVGVGYYGDAAGTEVLLVPISDGVAGAAVKVEAPAGGSNPYLSYVSCAQSNTCYAVGGYTDSSGNNQALLVPISAGSVGSAVAAPAPSNPSGVAQDAGLMDVSCAPSGVCFATGTYQDAANVERGMLVPIIGGTVEAAVQTPTPADESTTAPDDALDGVRCDTSGSCVAAGQYKNTSGTYAPFLVDLEMPLTVTTASLPAATAGTAYQQSLDAAGAWGSYGWSVSAGSLPAGLVLNAETGVISGTPTATGTATFTVQATGIGAPTQTAVQQLAITVAAAPITRKSRRGKPHVSLSGRRLQVRGGRLKLKLSCARATCRGIVKLQAREVVTVRHGKRRVRGHRTVVIGSRHFSLRAGHHTTLTAVLNRTGRRLLSRARHHQLAVRILAAAKGGNHASHAATIWLRAAKR